MKLKCFLVLGSVLKNIEQTIRENGESKRQLNDEVEIILTRVLVEEYRITPFWSVSLPQEY